MALTVAAGLLGALVAAILPTCLYLYVEPRGRLAWGVLGDTMATRRAPLLVRVTAWLTFAVGQLAFPALVVPAACAALLVLEVKLGVLRPVGAAATVALAIAALLQSLLALRLLPVGVRLLTRDVRLWKSAGSFARVNGMVSAGVIGVAALFGWAMANVPGLVHPWLRAALGWAAVRPVMAYAAVCLFHSLLLGRCARVRGEDPNPSGR